MATVSKWIPFASPNDVALDLTATASTVTRTSATKFTVKINVSWETYYSGAYTNFAITASSGGATAQLNTLGNKSDGSSGSLTGTYSISGNGSATKTITVTFKNFSTDKGLSATKNVTFNVTVPAWTSYTIKYNANGGSGAPGNQTKWKDQTLKLSTTKPTRTGYSFLGWSTSSTATSATYSAGANYTANSAATLYAVWKANTYAVTYNANGGTGAPSAQTKTYGKTLVLSSTKPTRTNYTFLGWSTSSTATTASYAAGANYTTNAAITLYAVWKLAYTKPTITGFSVDRCDSDGTLNDEGTNALVKFTWAISSSACQITVRWKASADIEWEHIVGSYGSGSAGPLTIMIGNNSLGMESTYDVYVEVEDSGGVTYRSAVLPGLVLPIDFKAGGKGVAFGKPAEMDNTVDFNYELMVRDSVTFKNNIRIVGVKPDGTAVNAFQPQNENGNTVLGYGNYENATGNTNIYGHDVLYGVSNIANPGTFRPYRRQGDSLGFTVRTAGYVTNSGKDVSFLVPFAVPIVGSPTVTVTSGTGFVLRQGTKYTHGSSASASAIPDSYSATVAMWCGVYVTAHFTDVTNVTNNDSIGIYWNGTITFT